MRQSLNLRLGQRLKLTPRLQQAIGLLQLSSLDLRAEIQRTLERNPFLERVEELPPDEGDGARDERPERADDIEHEPPRVAESAGYDAYDSACGCRDSRDFSAILENYSQPVSLADSLKQQIRAALIDERQCLVAEALVDNLDAEGYLDLREDELRALFRDHTGIGREDLERALCFLKTLEPAGIGARDLRERLQLQLAQCAAPARDKAHAEDIVIQHFALLSKRNFTALQRATGLDDDDLERALALIRGLDPNPATTPAVDPSTYVTPDLLVRRSNGGFSVELNADALDNVSLSPAYRTYLGASSNREDAVYFRQRYQEARWFLRSINQRNRTILKVGREIIRHQHEFLERGACAMKPLTLKKIAHAVGLHESTVSRATTQKYVLSPRGVHELKFFFSSELGARHGAGHSATSIQSRIRELVAGEPPGKPLSDQEIADRFEARGIVVARRTVAKYREQMNIPPSYMRKGFM